MSDATSEQQPPGINDSENVTVAANNELERKRLIDDLAFLALCQYRHRQYTAGDSELSAGGLKGVPD